MKGRMLTAESYPPPPPPPSPPTAKKDSRKILIIVLLLVIIIVSAGVLFYLATSGSSPTGNPTPTPTGMATPTPGGTGASPTPTGTSPTATPSGGTQALNYHAGMWAEYALKTYDEGVLASENTMKYAIDEGSYGGTNCWMMIMSTESQELGTKSVITYWLDKTTFAGIHMKLQMYVDGELTYENEEDLEPSDSSDVPEQYDMSTATSYETITVPAGTFNCGKVSLTTTVSGVTHTTNTWANPDVPVLGLVKIESTTDGVVSSTTELISYHS